MSRVGNYIIVNVTTIWVALCENVSFVICGQRRLRSSCASAQSDRGIHSPLTKSLDTTLMYEWRAKAPMIFYACTGWSESAHFARVQRHFFAWRSPHWPVRLWKRLVNCRLVSLSIRIFFSETGKCSSTLWPSCLILMLRWTIQQWRSYLMK